MNASKITVGVAGLLTAIAVGSAVQEVQAARTAAAALTAGQARRAVAAAALSRLWSRVAAAEQASAALRAAAERNERLHREAASAASGPTAREEAEKAGEAFLTEHPELREAMSDWERARITDRYASFYRSVALTPGQAARFEELMMAGRGMTAKFVGTPSMYWAMGPKEIPASEKEQQVREVLGSEAYAQLSEFNRLATARQMTRELAAGLDGTPTPLSAPQAAQLMPLLADAPPTGGPPGARDWDTILGRAATILSAPQLEFMRSLRETDDFNHAIRRARSAATTTSNAGTKPAP